MFHYPNNSDQVYCLYFKAPWKCSHFGVANNGLGKQVTYLINKIVDCRKGWNAVISYTHDYLNKHSIGVGNLSLQAENCSGQNKTNFFIFYLVWWMLKKIHELITYNFLLAGHTKLLSWVIACNWPNITKSSCSFVSSHRFNMVSSNSSNANCFTQPPFASLRVLLQPW